MRNLLLHLIPLLLALLALIWPSDRTRPRLLPLAGILHSALTLWLLFQPPAPSPQSWLGFDPLTRAVVPAISLPFLICSFYGVAYLRLRQERPNRIFVASLLALLGLITLSLQSQHLGLLWVAMEGATLVTVPLLHFNGTARAFEATWKYLLVGGTGVALSLLGSFFLGYSAAGTASGGDLTFAALVENAHGLVKPWVLAAWVVLLTGYGTKMGLAPMHTWKPDAYGEAPGLIGAILAGGLTTVAFVALLRVRQIVDAAGFAHATTVTWMALGLFSMFVAGMFLLGTPDFKRMLAYSSVEHMGILSFGAALGPAGVAAALFHVWNNNLAKGALFLSAGNLRRTVTARTAPEVSGLLLLAPVSSRLLIIGMFAVTACPPFGPFFSELAIIRSAFEGGHALATALFLTFLLLAFLGMSRLVFAITDGRPRLSERHKASTALPPGGAGGRPAAPMDRQSPKGSKWPEQPGVILPPVIFLGCSLLLGLATPPALRQVWADAVTFLFGS
jgi:hydrogenase-4 component F